MEGIMKIKLSFLVISILLFSFVIFAVDKLNQLGDVNLVNMGSYLKDGVLNISVFYKNRENDVLVFWKGGQVNCDCQVYTKLGDQKGDLITVSSSIMQRSDQKIYIDIPPQYLDEKGWGLVECSMNTGYNQFTVSDDFILK
jgi:hypothetical protein